MKALTASIDPMDLSTKEVKIDIPFQIYIYDKLHYLCKYLKCIVFQVEFEMQIK